ncbi:MAG: cytochrome c [Alphaproteobacteria bacterium]|nr:cytochrome c [Alphaproteobacteria bacterium]
MALALVLLPLAAAAQGPEVGRPFAERWCMACHVVERVPPAATADGVPSFPVIAARQTTTQQSLDAFLSTGHTRMPDFSLSRYERNALISYILSLR